MTTPPRAAAASAQKESARPMPRACCPGVALAARGCPSLLGIGRHRFTGSEGRSATLQNGAALHFREPSCLT
jgi:hypothetical protein